MKRFYGTKKWTCGWGNPLIEWVFFTQKNISFSAREKKIIMVSAEMEANQASRDFENNQFWFLSWPRMRNCFHQRLIHVLACVLFRPEARYVRNVLARNLNSATSGKTHTLWMGQLFWGGVSFSIGLSIWTPSFQFVILFGKVVWVYWRRYNTVVGFESP